MVGWFLLGEDSHGPHQLDLDGLVDLDDLIVFTLFSSLTAALSQGVALPDGWIDGWMD
jgi:hypothetical protein